MSVRVPAESPYYRAHLSRRGGAPPLLEIRPDVRERVRDRVTACAACGFEPCPRGIGNERATAQWLLNRAASRAPDEYAKSTELYHATDDCVPCASQLRVVVGLPDHVLAPVLRAIPEAERGDMLSFMEHDFVFALCGECATSAYEGERLSRADIEGRFERMLVVQYGRTDLAPEVERLKLQLFELIDRAIRARRQNEAS